MPAFAKGRRLRDCVAKRCGGAIDKTVFDAQIPCEDAIFDRILTNLAKEAMTDDSVPSRPRFRTHVLGKLPLVTCHGATRAMSEATLEARPLDKAASALQIDRVPPAALDLQRAGYDNSVDDGEDVPNIVGCDAAADNGRQRSGGLNGADVGEIGNVAGALTRGYNDIGVEELDVAHKLGNRSVLNDCVRAVLYVHVGEDPHGLGAELPAIAGGVRRSALD